MSPNGRHGFGQAVAASIFGSRSRGARFSSIRIIIGKSEICVVTMTGAKTGKKRDIPLMYVPHRDGVLLVASLGGAPRHPTWYYNLVANPDIEVLVGKDKTKLRARRASPAEKVDLWSVCCKYYPPYDEYQRRTERDIPVFVCEPRD